MHHNPATFVLVGIFATAAYAIVAGAWLACRWWHARQRRLAVDHELALSARFGNPRPYRLFGESDEAARERLDQFFDRWADQSGVRFRSTLWDGPLVVFEDDTDEPTIREPPRETRAG